jgi:hypothetical protein
MKHYTVYLALWVLLAGCLADETPCSYFRLTEKELQSNVWNVDSFSIHVADSAEQYYFDTVYANYGEWIFVPEKPYECGGGLVNLTPYNGATQQLTYSFDSWMYGDLICLGSNAPLDGLNKPFQGCACVKIGDKISIGWNCGFWPGSSPYRKWHFVLSKK